MKLSYQNALMAEVHRFSKNIRSRVERGMHQGTRVGE